MVIYEVNVDIQTDIYEQYYAWLLEHIPQMLNFDGFIKADIGVVKQDFENNEKKLRISYHIDNEEHLQTYLKNHAMQMRSEGIAKFGDKFRASRRIIVESVLFEK